MGDYNINLTKAMYKDFLYKEEEYPTQNFREKEEMQQKGLFSGFGLILFLKVPNHNNSWVVV